MILLLMFITFLITLVFILFFIKNAEKFGFVDIPNERSMHTKPIPRGAGIAFVLSSLLVSLILILLGYNNLNRYYLVYIAIALIFSGGVLDDKKGISPKAKFLFIFLGTLILYSGGIYIRTLGTYLGHELLLPAFLTFPFTFFAIAGFTNALNLLDGLDGLAGTVSIVILGAFMWIGYLHHDELMVMLSTIFIASLMAFLLFNWNPARVFMGDSGSLTLGFVISILAIRATNYISPTAVLFILAIPVLDTFVVMTRRIQRGRSPFSADKNHMHHILFKRYEDVKYTVIVIVYIQIAFTMIGYQLRNADDFLSLVLFGILFFIFLALLDQRKKHRKKRMESLKIGK
ncbi:MraY family glycosyltransferase [Hydrogenimonas sp.]